MKFTALVGFIFVTTTALAVPSTESPITGDVYQVKKGDWLSKIAIRKWGEMSKWNDLWELNQQIKNPHLIYPGQRLRLLSSGNIEFMDSRLEATRGNPVTKFRTRSEEWRLLPPQSWEKYIFVKDAAIDPLGFDRRSKAQKRFVNRTPMTSTIATDRLAVHGEITHARSDYEHVFLGDQVFVRADEPLQVGSVYSLTSGPQKVTSKRDGRVGFVYDIIGKLKIIGVRDGTFIATVIELQGFIARGALLIPEVKQIEFKKPVASPAVISGTVVFNENTKQTMVSEHSTVFLDVGSNDGVQPGMIFRNYLHKDPYTGGEISTQDYLIEAEMIVMDVKEQFSSAILLSGRGGLPADSPVTSLTDLTDFKKHMGLQTSIQDSAPIGLPDELDEMDTDQGLGEKEETELRQLEKISNPDEIKREYPSGETTLGVGEEPAPNDTLAKPPETAPAPEAPPADAPPAPIEEAPAPPPAPEANPLMEAPPPADPLDEPAPSTLQNPAELQPGPSVNSSSAKPGAAPVAPPAAPPADVAPPAEAPPAQ